MFVVRLVHAAFSMITVIYGYKITLKIAGQKTAGQVGLMLAALWFVPWISVRNLVEIVATHLLMLSTWFLFIRKDKKSVVLYCLLAGFIAGLAFSVRYQTAFFTAGLGLVLLIEKKWQDSLLFGIGGTLAILLIQGGIDMAIWGQPFAEMGEYIQYNIDNRYNFFTGEWYSYLLLLGGILLPPVSLFILFGMFVEWRKNLLLFLPAFLFLIFHIYFPNKQERFILTIVPFIVMAGLIGWNKFLAKSNWWTGHTSLYRGIWAFFWVLNSIVLMPVSTMYSKRSRAEAMTYLYRYKGIKTMMAENANAGKLDILPQFYAGQHISINDIHKDRLLLLDTQAMRADSSMPRFVLFYTAENLDARVKHMKAYYPELVFETSIEPGFVDQILYKLNPKNTNQIIYIYRNTYYFPEKK